MRCFSESRKSAIVVKNASKVTLFVGTIALSWWTSALAAWSTLAKTAVIVSWADLTLEITDDTAKMALWNKNKISTIVGDVRKITEPAAAILMVSTLPNNLVKGIDKLNAVVFGADQLNSTIQQWTTIGIKLNGNQPNKSSQTMQVSVLEKEDINEWLTEQKLDSRAETIEDIEKVLGIKSAIDKKEDENIQQTPNIVKGKETPKNDKAEILISEFNDLSDKGSYKSMGQIKKSFWEPDYIASDKNGRIVYIYLDRIKYPSNNNWSIRFTFYTLEDYKKIAESAFWWDEDYQEIWDDSDWWLTASTEIKDREYFDNMYWK